jgi:flagellar secretion chaperone FliS
MTQYATNQYKMTQVNTADQGKLILMMYDGAIRFVEIAKTKLTENDVAGKGIYITKAEGIISELMASLNMESGGEIAVSLEKLYVFMNKQLRIANVNKDTKPLDAVISLLATVREGWHGVFLKNPASSS